MLPSLDNFKVYKLESEIDSIFKAQKIRFKAFINCMLVYLIVYLFMYFADIKNMRCLISIAASVFSGYLGLQLAYQVKTLRRLKTVILDIVRRVDDEKFCDHIKKWAKKIKIFAIAHIIIIAATAVIVNLV